MSAIVCAIRGGPASKPTTARAIALAQETGFRLHFLYVVSLNFMAHTESSRVRRVSHDLHQLGEFILLTATLQAEAAGIQAESHVRHGQLIEEIEAQILELEAKYLVLGAPQEAEEEDAFDLERLNAFARRIEEDTGVQVILATEGEA
ncbi:MAG: universal stress protein [Anaerolineales bacterium]|jgi:nucleotide-binding universal stress UspA family protein